MGGARSRAEEAVLTVTDVGFVMVFLRGGVVPPPASCRTTSLEKHKGIGHLLL
jgi:hypothetical protein